MSDGAPLRVCWLVPGFPTVDDPASYPFLGREADELVATGRVDLRVLSEVLDGRPDGSAAVEALVRPTTRVAQAEVLGRAIATGPDRLQSILRPRHRYPTLWRVGSMIRHVKEFAPDVVHSHFAVPLGTCGVPVARASGAVSVVSLRGVELVVDAELEYGHRRDGDYERAFRSSLSEANLCLTATKRMRDLAVQAGAGASRTVILPNSSPARSQLRAEPVTRPSLARHLVVSAGHLIRRKGFDRGIRGLALLPHDWHYVLLGEGPERGPLMNLATELGVADRVHPVGKVAPSAVWSWMQEADIFWFLSRAEAFGNVILEAFRAGRPIVATAEGVAPELLQADAWSVVLRAADDPSELAAATRALADSAADAPDREPALEPFDPERRARRLLELYRATIEAAAQ